MPTTTPVSVEQYLSTSYHPDVEYVDGELVGSRGRYHQGRRWRAQNCRSGYRRAAAGGLAQVESEIW